MNDDDRGFEHFGPCQMCGGPTHTHAWVLSRKFESFDPATAHEAAAFGCEWSVNVSNGEAVACYCSDACWRAAEPDVRAKLGIRYENMSDPPWRTCSKCGVIFDGRQPFLAYDLSEEQADEVGPEVTVLWANEFAMFCSTCMHAVDAGVLEQPSPERTLARPCCVAGVVRFSLSSDSSISLPIPGFAGSLLAAVVGRQPHRKHRRPRLGGPSH